ncbi:MAG: hypothetical protein WAL75_01130 [Terracidiphilus sp.]
MKSRRAPIDLVDGLEWGGDVDDRPRLHPGTLFQKYGSADAELPVRTWQEK